MRQIPFSKLLAIILALILLPVAVTLAQSKKQLPAEKPNGTQKKNSRPTETPTPTKEDQDKKEAEKAVEDPEVVKIATNIVNVDAVVYSKKSNQIVTGLKKENFAVFEN